MVKQSWDCPEYCDPHPCLMSIGKVQKWIHHYSIVLDRTKLRNRLKSPNDKNDFPYPFFKHNITRHCIHQTSHRREYMYCIQMHYSTFIVFIFNKLFLVKYSPVYCNHHNIGNNRNAIEKVMDTLGSEGVVEYRVGFL